MSLSSAALTQLLQDPRIWRGDSLAQAGGRTHSSGFAALDAELPGGGWPLGALSELIAPPGSGSFSLLQPLLRRHAAGGGQIMLVNPPAVPYAPAWAQAGIDPAAISWLSLAAEADCLWACEQALREAGCLVLAWPARPLADRTARRLQLAAETGGGSHFLLYGLQKATLQSPLGLRLRLEPGAEGLYLHIVKRRGRPLQQPIVLPGLATLPGWIPHAASGPVLSPAGTGPRLSLVGAGSG